MQQCAKSNKCAIQLLEYAIPLPRSKNHNQILYVKIYMDLSMKFIGFLCKTFVFLCDFFYFFVIVFVILVEIYWIIRCVAMCNCTLYIARAASDKPNSAILSCFKYSPLPNDVCSSLIKSTLSTVLKFSHNFPNILIFLHKLSFCLC